MASSGRRPPTVVQEGQVVASFGRRYLVELPGNTILDCVTRGKKSDIACGDRVMVSAGPQGTGVIEKVAPRSTLLYRSDAHREKLIAANATQIAVVVAAVPGFHEDLVNRCLAAAEHGGMAALIVLNKCDLAESAGARAALETYRRIGYRVLALSARHDIAPLVPLLADHTSVLVGQSGMGKSTIINRLLPEAGARVGEISATLGSGRHTTTHARLYHLDSRTHVIDSPGLQEFGLHHLTLEDTAHAFREFRPWLGQCRFRDCRHLAEPGCAVAAACAAGEIAGQRLDSYRKLAAAASHRKAW